MLAFISIMCFLILFIWDKLDEIDAKYMEKQYEAEGKAIYQDILKKRVQPTIMPFFYDKQTHIIKDELIINDKIINRKELERELTCKIMYNNGHMYASCLPKAGYPVSLYIQEIFDNADFATNADIEKINQEIYKKLEVLIFPERLRKY